MLFLSRRSHGPSKLISREIADRNSLPDTPSAFKSPPAPSVWTFEQQRAEEARGSTDHLRRERPHLPLLGGWDFLDCLMPLLFEHQRER